MCGIAGVVTWDEKYRVKREQLQRMADALAHRGPDGEGFYLNFEDREITPENPQCGFAFRRLAIIDPDPRSNQPFRIGDLTLVFNGEIYNFRDLKSEISNLRPDYQWRTQGDAEVLLMSYAVWQEQCVERLNGMFAFAVWDDREKSLFLARDRMGQKPLYLWHDLSDAPKTPGKTPRTIAFASEISALRKIPFICLDLSEAGVSEFLALGYMRGFTTAYQQLWKLLPGSWWKVDRSGELGDNYFVGSHCGRPKGDEPPGDAEAGGAACVLVQRAVQRQLVSDVPLGCFLSGGIDSSIIALSMRNAVGSGDSVKTFSIGFDDPRYDETKFAKTVAEHLGTDHREFVVQPDIVADLPKLVQVFGEPFADSSAIPTQYLARETRRIVKVALSGEGGDELFGGYDRYRALRRSEVFDRLPPPVRQLAAIGSRRIGASDQKAVGARVQRFLAGLRYAMPSRYESYVRLFDEDTVQDLYPNNELKCSSPLSLAYEYEAQFAHGSSAAAAALDRVTYLPDDLLTKIDRCSMLHGLEVRSPFMDHELVQFAAGLTTEQLLKGGPKRMLREAFAKDLPDFVFKRPKMGFAVPIGEWFRGELRPMLRENLFASDSFGKQHFNMKVVQRLVDEHETQRVDHSQRLYALLMLELWWRWYRS